MLTRADVCSQTLHGGVVWLHAAGLSCEGSSLPRSPGRSEVESVGGPVAGTRIQDTILFLRRRRHTRVCGPLSKSVPAGYEHIRRQQEQSLAGIDLAVLAQNKHANTKSAWLCAHQVSSVEVGELLLRQDDVGHARLVRLRRGGNSKRFR